MSDAARKYEENMARLLIGRRLGTLSEEREDSLLEGMDDLWWAMSPEEQQQFEERAARFDAGSIAESPFGVDVEVSPQTSVMPRRAA